MHFKFIIGVDISKEWFNFCLMNGSLDILWEGQTGNDPGSISLFIENLLKRPELEGATLGEILLCMEHTGIYIQHLSKCWLSKEGKLWVIHASKISESLAGKVNWEEKDDPMDARRIAEYATRFQDRVQLTQLEDQTIVKLQRFQRQRERLGKATRLLEVPVNESKAFDTADISNALVENQQKAIKALKEDIKNIGEKMQELIESDPALKQLYRLISSVEGVGKVTATEIIITTGAFTQFLPNQAKSYLRYLGVTPVRKQSGKSVRRKNKITKRKHKKMKSLLTMGARSLIGTGNELGQYYERKMGEGKHHLSVINAMRNKIILRVFAVVRNQVMYQKNLNLMGI